MADLRLEVERFKQALLETPDAWASVDVRVFAIRAGNGWQNVYTVAVLDPRSVDLLPEPEIFAQTQSAVALRVSFARDQLLGLVQQVQAGTAAFGDTSVAYTEGRGSDFYANYHHGYTRIAELLSDQPLVGPHFVGHELVVSGDSASTLINSVRGGAVQLSRELQASAIPWDGIDGLMEHAIRTRHKYEHYAAQLRVVAPLPVRFLPQTTRLRGQTLTFAVETANAALTEHVSVGFVATSMQELGERGTLKPTVGVDWRPSGKNVIWDISREHIVGEKIALFARVGPFVVDRIAVVDESLRVQRSLVTSYETVDPEMARLSQWLLSPQQSEQVEFERAVARVFLFCGFQVDSFAGDKRLGDTVDLVAHAPDLMIMLVVECTTGALQSRDGKLSRLVQRTNAIREAMEKAGDPALGTVVMPIIATSLIDVAVSDGIAAKADKITVLTNQRLSALLSIARSGAGPAAAMAVIRGYEDESTSLSGGLFSGLV